MDAKCCDRCGEFYIPKNFKYFNKITYATDNTEKSIDVCPRCMDEFLDWFADSGQQKVFTKDDLILMSKIDSLMEGKQI